MTPVGSYQGPGMQFSVPCGQCRGCRLDKSRDWAIRCVHETQTSDYPSYFVTFTYDDDHVPHSLDVKHWQTFCRKLRKRIKPFRYYHCGEYGEQTQRSHLHACLFNVDLPRGDLVKHTETLHRSRLLETTWSQGHVLVGSLTFDSAAYVARYVTKKQTGKQAETAYQSRKPPYATMSRKPGLGKRWIEKYLNDVYPHDYVVMHGGRKFRPPRYYDDYLEEVDPELYERVRKDRRKRVRDNAHELTADRLATRERCAKAKHHFFKRNAI